MITAQATELLQRVQALTLRECVIAIGVASLVAAIAWTGRTVSRLIDMVDALQARVQFAEANLTNAADQVATVDEQISRVDKALAKRMRNVELRQDRLQSFVENWGKNWRDSGQPTANLKFTGPVTKIDLQKL